MSTVARQPAIYVPHGGGPWPFVDLRGFASPRDVQTLRRYFEDLPRRLPQAPRAVLVVSAHWEAPEVSVMGAAYPCLLHDYGGFPPEAYALEWSAAGDPELAERVAQRLGAAGLSTRADPERGFDHGTFVPLKVAWPQADIPTIQVSLKAGLDAAEHLAMGQALAPFRNEGVLILGSGMSYHNMRGFRSKWAHSDSLCFDAWLREAATAKPPTRERLLCDWESAPAARASHPREEHLLPLMVVAGAAGEDQGHVTFNEDWMNARISAVHYG